MEKRNEIVALKTDELSLDELLGERANELPERALMRRGGRRHHRRDEYDYCYNYDYCYGYGYGYDYCYYDYRG